MLAATKIIEDLRRENADLKAKIAASEAALHRFQHGQQIEGDYVCEAALKERAVIDDLRKQLTDSEAARLKAEVNTCGNLSRFDLVVFVEFKPKLIIEVKKKTKSHKYRGEQVRKYSSHKLPVVVIAGMDHALRFVKNFFRKYPDLRWAEKPQPEWSI